MLTGGNLIVCKGIDGHNLINIVLVVFVVFVIAVLICIIPDRISGANCNICTGSALRLPVPLYQNQIE